MICCRVSPNLKEWTYCNGLMEANAITWNKLYDIYVNKSDENSLTYLICSENPDIIINFLNMSTPKNQYSISILDFQYDEIYYHIIIKHAKNNVVIDYILTNFKITMPRYFNNIFNINCKHILIFVFIHYKSFNFLQNLQCRMGIKWFS